MVAFISHISLSARLFVMYNQLSSLKTLIFLSSHPSLKLTVLPQDLDLRGVLSMFGKIPLYMLMTMIPSWLVVPMEELVATCSMRSCREGGENLSSLSSRCSYPFSSWYLKLLFFLNLLCFPSLIFTCFSLKIVIRINVSRCVESGVSYLSSKVERITEAASGQSLIECENNIAIPCRYCGISFIRINALQ